MQHTHDVQKAKEYFENKMAFTTGPVELSYKLKDPKFHIVDVRAAEDFAKGHIPGSVNLPMANWEHAQAVLDKGKINVLYCYSHVCHLAAKAAVQFAALGYQVMEMDGGFKSWAEYKLEVEM